MEETTRRDQAADPAGAGESTEQGGAAEVEHDLDALLADVKRERDEYLALAQRARADFENFRKRATRDAKDAEHRGKASIAKELLPALDNLERALRSTGIDPASGRPAAPGRGAEGGADPAAPGRGAEEAAGMSSFDAPSEEVSAREALARGVALVYGELRAALERAGVVTYDPAGERFDPTTSEALATRPAQDGVEPGVVIETLERGYRLDGQVLRAARVVVSE